MNKAILILILTIILPMTTFGAVIHIPDDYPTFAEAIAAASSGDTVLAADGTYSASGIEVNKSLLIRSENGPFNCIINGGNRAFVIGAAVTLQGLTIRNCHHEHYYAAYAGAVRGNETLIVDSCIFYNNSLYGSGNDHGTARGGAIDYAARVSNSIFYNNDADGDTWSCGGAVYYAAEVVNCTFYNNWAGSGSAVGHSNSIVNSIVWNCYDPFHTAESVTYCCVGGGWEGEGNFNVDSEVTDDFHLNDYSPCINAGTQVSLEYDIDGEARPGGGKFDVGADEFYDPSWTPTPTFTPTPTNTAIPEDTPTPVPWTGVKLILPDDTFTAGDIFRLRAQCNGEPGDTKADLYVILDVQGEYWFYPAWTQEPQSHTVILPEAHPVVVFIFEFRWPEGDLGSADGLFFRSALMRPGSSDIIGDVDAVEFGYF